MHDKSQKIFSLYKITNLVNNKIYIGQTTNPRKRWYDHRIAIKNPKQVIHHAMAKYGLDNFTFEVIAQCRTQDDANWCETELVSQYQSHISTGKGYNILLGGMTCPKTEEWKQFMSEFMTNWHQDHPEHTEKMQQLHQQHPEWSQALNAAGRAWQAAHPEHLGKGLHTQPHTEEAKRAMSQARLANPTNSWEGYSEEEKQARCQDLQEAGFGKTDLKGEKHPMYGKHHTEESRAKIKEARARQVMPVYTEERREKLRKSQTGKKATPEARLKMSQAAKKRRS